MALVAETATAALSANTSENIDSMMEPDGLSRSSSETSSLMEPAVPLIMNNATEETQISPKSQEEEEEPVIMNTSETEECIVEELVSPTEEQDNNVIDGAEMIVDPAETEIMDASSNSNDESDNNKENTEESSTTVITPATGSDGDGEGALITDLVTETIIGSAGDGSGSNNDSDPKVIKGQDVSEESITNDVKCVDIKEEKPKLQDLKNEIDKVIHKSVAAGVVQHSEVKNELGAQFREIKKSDLETLIMDKIIEAITIHSHVGSLNQKLIQSNTQKDRLFHKVANLQRQVVELTKAVRSLSENVGRNPKTVNKANQPIRFYRSVGVQVVLEGAPVPIATSTNGQCQQRDISNKSVLKSGNNKTPPVTAATNAEVNRLLGRTTVQTSTQPLSVIGNVNPGLKRTIAKQTISVADVSKQLDQNKIRRISSSPVSTPLGTPTKTTTEGLVNGRSPQQQQATIIARQQPPHLTPLVSQQQPVMRNPAAVAAMNSIANTNAKATVEPGVVDLTDDDVTPVSSIPRTVITTQPATTAVVANGKGNNVLLMNGLQYRLAGPTAQQVQLITQNGQSYQLITSAPAPILVRAPTLQTVNGQPVVRPLTAGSNQLILRGFPPQAQGTVASVISGGQFMVRPMKPVTTAVSAVQPVKQPQVTIAPRQVQPQTGAAVTTMPTRTALSNGVAARMSNNVITKAVAQPVVTNRVATKPLNDAVKKFMLPPLPPPAVTGNPRRGIKDIPPRPELTLTEQNDGIVLSWNLKLGPNHAEIQTYQIYACQEPLFNNQKSGNASWKRVGDVKALPLPMACTLSQFVSENRYHFIVRGVDVYNRTGPFCEASAITLSKKS